MTQKKYKFPRRLTRVTLDFDPENPDSKSRTKQSFRDEANINNIVARAVKTGYLVDPSIHTTRKPMYGDFTSGTDFQSAADRVLAARQIFDALPATVREKFGHNPSEFIDFASDPANADALVEMGLMPKEDKAPPLNDVYPASAGEEREPSKAPASSPGETEPATE